MKLALCGPVQGSICDLYDKLKALDSEVNWALCAGDFGIWPDPHRMSKAAREHAKTDFAKLYLGSVQPSTLKVPILTIEGVHDDHKWIKERIKVKNLEILSNVHLLAQGRKTVVGYDVEARVTGFGKAYSEASFSGKMHKKSSRHYTRRELEKACSSGPTDILIVYEHLDAPGIRNLIFATRPKLIVGVNHLRGETYDKVQNTAVIQLNRNEVKVINWNDYIN